MRLGLGITLVSVGGLSAPAAAGMTGALTSPSSTAAATLALSIPMTGALTSPKSTATASLTLQPAVWGGVQPVRHWDMADSVVTTGSDIDSVPNHTALSSAPLTGVASNKPQRVSSSAVLNSKKTASFTSTQRFTFGDLGVGTGACSIAIVYKTTTDADTTQIAFSTTNNHVFIYSDTSAHGIVITQSAGASGITAAVDEEAKSVVLSTFSGSTQRGYVNSTTEKGNASASTPTYSGGGVVGNYAPSVQAGLTLKGEIGEIIVWDVLLSSGQRSAAMTALATKYGITLV